jgi:hypothetical protein
MQHGTGRELLNDSIENALAVLEGGRKRNGWPVSDVIIDLRRALNVLNEQEDAGELDDTGRYGPDYGAPRVTKAERDEAFDRYAEWVGKGRPEGGF